VSPIQASSSIVCRSRCSQQLFGTVVLSEREKPHGSHSGNSNGLVCYMYPMVAQVRRKPELPGAWPKLPRSRSLYTRLRVVTLEQSRRMSRHTSSPSFTLASPGGVLLDEANVFMEQRSLDDLQRNVLISVFLRLLEYYDGILILTSNRVGTLDETFMSRIQQQFITAAWRHIKVLRYGAILYSV
jgi:hypothetical protein